MKFRMDSFSKSFLISLVAFALIAAIVIAYMYMDRVAVDPTKRESNLLIGLTHNGKLLSISMLNCDPKNNEITYLAIPDNTMLSDGRILQDLYGWMNTREMISSIEDITGARVNRYIFFSTDAVYSITNDVGKFEYLIRFPFKHNDIEHSGNTYMNGELSKAMFTYGGYDMTNVSLSIIGESFLQNFLSKHANNSSIDKLTDAIVAEKSSLHLNTNLSNDEIVEYCSFFANFSTLNQSTVSIDGEIRYTSTNKFFYPTNNKSDKNIFK